MTNYDGYEYCVKTSIIIVYNSPFCVGGSKFFGWQTTIF